MPPDMKSGAGSEQLRIHPSDASTVRYKPPQIPEGITKRTLVPHTEKIDLAPTVRPPLVRKIGSHLIKLDVADKG